MVHMQPSAGHQPASMPTNGYEDGGTLQRDESLAQAAVTDGGDKS